jgi:hypothetical protein
MIKFFKWLFRVKFLAREKRSERERVDAIAEAGNTLLHRAKPIEIMWLARRAILGCVSDYDIGGPEESREKADQMIDIYGEINDIIKKHFGEDAAKES